MIKFNKIISNKSTQIIWGGEYTCSNHQEEVEATNNHTMLYDNSDKMVPGKFLEDMLPEYSTQIMGQLV